MPEITTPTPTTPTPSPLSKEKDDIGINVLSKAIVEEDEEAKVSDLSSEEHTMTEAENKMPPSADSGKHLDRLNQSRRASSLRRLGGSLRGSGSLRRSGSLRQLSASLTRRKRRNKNKKKRNDFHYRSRSIPEVKDGVDTQEQDGSLKKRINRLTPLINYEVFQWTWFIILCLLAIVDRFTWNVWPRQTYSIGAGSAGSDRLSGFKPGPWSVVLYDSLARVSGRYSIICYNFLLITRLECLEHLMTSNFVKTYLLDTSNIVNANVRLHSWNGIALCVMTLLHVWSILFPCITHGYTAVVVPGVWEWPASERTPVKCSVVDEPGCWPGDANVELKQMGLQVDDVFRMVEMTIFLCILLPISVRWFASKWHAGVHLHRLVNLVYFVDIVRRHSHPHSWILNTPVFALYIFDKHVFTYFYKRNKSPTMKRIRLGKDFMVLYWKSQHQHGLTDTIGPDYSMLLNDSSFFEQKHVFTCFENRSGKVLEESNDNEDEDDEEKWVEKDKYQNEAAEDNDWTVGVVIRVFRRERSPVLGKKDKVSHTQRMYEQEPLMLVTGPRQGEMSEMVRLEMLRDRNDKLVLLGAGSAINFIIDALQWCTVNSPIRRKISLAYTTRDYDLFQWAMTAISNLVPLCEARGIFFDVKMAYTGPMMVADDSMHGLVDSGHDTLDPSEHNSIMSHSMHGYDLNGMTSSKHDLGMSTHSTRDLPSSKHDLSMSTHSTRSIASHIDSVKTQPNRFDLYGEIESNSTVFCQGSAGLKNAVETVCKSVGARFYGGRGGAREDLLS